MANFKFRRHMSLGDVSAERDEMLKSAFVDTGDLETLVDVDRAPCIVIGRTGAGKSALLRMMEERNPHRTLRLRPESLSLQYLEGSTIIPVLSSMGVRLNFFWTLFWRHIITLELLQAHYQINSAQDQENFFVRIIRRNNKKNERREAALNYIRDWAGEFWKNSDVRTKKLLETLERTVKASGGAELLGAKLSADASRRSEQKVEEEVVSKAQEAVNRIQFQHLDEVLSILEDDVLDDPQKPYYIIIDDLDKEWVESAYVYDLIDALIDEAGTMRLHGNVKVVVALRENILAQVNNRLAGKRGRQREKHEGLMLRLKWHRADLTRMMDKRLQELMRGSYGERASMEKILPYEPHRGRDTGNAVAYILDRTIQRPRDLIKFFNLCIEKAEGRGRIEWQNIFAAERKYSVLQLQSLIDEWAENFPDIADVLETFRELPRTFEVEEFDDARIVALVVLGERDVRQGAIGNRFVHLCNGGLEPREALRRFVLPLLYNLCFVGVKASPTDRLLYFYDDPDLLSGTIPSGARIQVHPAFWSALGIQGDLSRA